MKETREMMKILEENKAKAQKREYERKIKEQQKQQQEKEAKRTATLLVLTVILLILSIALLKNIMDKDYGKCIESGRSEQQCERYRSIDK